MTPEELNSYMLTLMDRTEEPGGGFTLYLDKASLDPLNATGWRKHFVLWEAGHGETQIKHAAQCLHEASCDDCVRLALHQHLEQVFLYRGQIEAKLEGRAGPFPENKPEISVDQTSYRMGITRSCDIACWILDAGYEPPKSVDAARLAQACARVRVDIDDTEALGELWTAKVAMRNTAIKLNSATPKKGTALDSGSPTPPLQEALRYTLLDSGGVRLNLQNESFDCRNRGGELLRYALQRTGGCLWVHIPKHVILDDKAETLKKSAQRALQKAPPTIKDKFRITQLGIEVLIDAEP